MENSAENNNLEKVAIDAKPEQPAADGATAPVDTTPPPLEKVHIVVDDKDDVGVGNARQVPKRCSRADARKIFS